ncbi:MAG: alpha/beta hydrolase [Bacillus sp. (in: firmicutes)]
MGENVRVIIGAESFYLKGNEIGILISHGFMGTPQSVQYVGESLAALGYTVLAPRLKGHGTTPYDLEKCTYQDWFKSLELGYQFLKQRCQKIFVIGQSMGGTLTLHLAKKYHLDGITLINTALSLPSLDYLAGETVTRFIEEGKPDIKANDVHEITYSHAPVQSIQQLQQLMKKTPEIFSSITSPVLGIRSAVDHVVPPENTNYILENVQSAYKKLVILQNSYHVASMDHDKEQIVEEAHQFIQEQLKGRLQAI